MVRNYLLKVCLKFFSNMVTNIFIFFIELLIRRNIIYAKIFQWINLKNILFTEDVNKYLSKYTDNVPYNDSEIEYLYLEKLASKVRHKNIDPHTQTYVNILIDSKPINSGTISIVFKGTLFYSDDTSEEVVIKIKRKDISKKIHNVISDINYLNNIYSFIYRKENVLLTNLICDVRDKFLEQVNFVNEQENILLIQKKLSNFKNVVTVKLYENLSDDNIIVMSYINGKSIYQLSELEKKDYLESFIKTTFYLIFKKNIFHMDLHPGNLLFLPDKKICLLDLGMILNIDDIDIKFYEAVWYSIIKKDSDKIRILFTDNKECFLNDDENINKNIDIFKKIFDSKVLFQNMDMINIIEDIKYLILVSNEKNIKFKGNVHKVILSVITFLPTLLMFDNKDFFEELLKNFESYFS